MSEAKKTRGRWQPGQSGNPRGRTPGSGEVGSLRAAIGERVPEILEQLITRALDGDVQAARLLLERAIPPLKAAEQLQPVAMPKDGDLSARGRAVLDAVSDGDIPPTTGAALLTAIGTLARVLEVDELERRLSALEEASGKH